MEEEAQEGLANEEALEEGLIHHVGCFCAPLIFFSCHGFNRAAGAARVRNE
jgi:hypothetical protein